MGERRGARAERKAWGPWGPWRTTKRCRPWRRRRRWGLEGLDGESHGAAARDARRARGDNALGRLGGLGGSGAQRGGAGRNAKRSGASGPTRPEERLELSALLDNADSRGPAAWGNRVSRQELRGRPCAASRGYTDLDNSAGGDKRRSVELELDGQELARGACMTTSTFRAEFSAWLDEAFARMRWTSRVNGGLVAGCMAAWGCADREVPPDEPDRHGLCASHCAQIFGPCNPDLASLLAAGGPQTEGECNSNCVDDVAWEGDCRFLYGEKMTCSTELSCDEFYVHQTSVFDDPCFDAEVDWASCF